MKYVIICSIAILAWGCSNTKTSSNEDLSATSKHLDSTDADTILPNSKTTKLELMNQEEKNKNAMPETEEEWKEKLSSEEYRVLREKGTERAHTGQYDQHWDSGVYICKGCGIDLFTSDTKFDAHCGWPSFYKGIDKSKIKEVTDNSYGMSRIEVQCANCGGHLGHVFNDGPEPSGLRYCINSVSLGFEKKKID